MKVNTVLLDVYKYNELHDLYTNIAAGKKLALKHMHHSTLSEYYTDNEIAELLVKEHNEIVEEHNEKNKDLKNTNALLYTRLSTALESEEIKDLKLMSYWQWRKWRKQK